MHYLINKYLLTDKPIRERLFYLAAFMSNVACFIYASFCVFMRVDLRTMLIYVTMGILGIVLFVLEDKFHKTTLFSIILLLINNIISFPTILYFEEKITVEIPLYMMIGLIYALVLLDGALRIIMIVIQIAEDLGITYYCFVYRNQNEIAYGAVEASEFVRLLIAIITAGIICGVIVAFRNDVLNQQIKIKEEATKKAEEVSAAKDTFLVNVSHEIRTPLNAILGTTDMLLASDTSNHVKEMAMSISNSSKALLSITTDLLDFSRMNMDAITIDEDEYDLGSLLSDIINLMAVRLLDSNVNFYVNINPKLPKFVKGDAGKVRQIIINLLSNAIKYTNEGHMDLNVDFNMEDDGKMHLLIDVADTGIGIKEESIEKIFEPYNRSGEKTDRIIEGNGLGLALCKKMAAAMGGSLKAESVYQKGSVFYFEVHQEVSKENTDVVGAINDLECKIAVFSDSETDANSFVKTCSSMKLLCKQASKDEEFLNMLKNGKYNFYFVDISAYERLKKFIEEFNIDWSKVVVISNCNYSYSGEPFEFVLTKPISCLNISDIVNGTRKFNVTRINYNNTLAIPDVTILVVDDNLVNLTVAQGLLERYKPKVITAASGKEALNILEGTRVDLIFLDYMMPDMDGIDTLKAIRALPFEFTKTIPIVALTANVVSGAREMFLKEGFTDYLSKPIETEMLEKILKEDLKLNHD